MIVLEEKKVTNPHETLSWRRKGWVVILVIGWLATVQVLCLSLQAGLEDGYRVGVQTLETGQVQIESPQGAIGPYFMVRTLAENRPGVVASSARLDFFAQLSLPMGLSQVVHIRACNFFQEDKVTDFVRRIVPLGDSLYSGLVLSRDLSSDPLWAGAPSLTIGDPDHRFESVSLPVSGHIFTTAGRTLDHIVYLDLGTALRVMGSNTPVSTVVLKLQKGVDPGEWVEANQDTFRGFNLVAKPWDAVLNPGFPPRSTVLGPITYFLNGILITAGIEMLLIGFFSRRPQSGLALAVRGDPRERWLAFGGLFGTTVASTVVLVALSSLFPEWLLKGFEADYPFLGAPRLIWGWDLGVFLTPIATILATVSIALWPRKVRPQARERAVDLRL